MPSMFRVLLIPVLALVTSLALGALVMLLFGDDPILAYQGLFQGAFGSGRAWSSTKDRSRSRDGRDGRREGDGKKGDAKQSETDMGA